MIITIAIGGNSMVCKSSMTWKRAMAMAKNDYPRASLSRRRKIAGSIVGGLRASGHIKKRRK